MWLSLMQTVRQWPTVGAMQYNVTIIMAMLNLHSIIDILAAVDPQVHGGGDGGAGGERHGWGGYRHLCLDLVLLLLFLSACLTLCLYCILAHKDMCTYKWAVYTVLIYMVLSLTNTCQRRAHVRSLLTAINEHSLTTIIYCKINTLKSCELDPRK